jgi:hypothetical protein
MTKKKSSFGSTQVIMFISALVGCIFTIIAAIVTREWLYGVAGVLLLLSGVLGVIVVNRVKRKLDGQ